MLTTSALNVPELQQSKSVTSKCGLAQMDHGDLHFVGAAVTYSTRVKTDQVSADPKVNDVLELDAPEGGIVRRIRRCSF